MARRSGIDGPDGPIRVGDDISSLLERAQSVEEHLGVSFNGLSARLGQSDDASPVVEVFGELRSTSGATIAQDTWLKVAVYDRDGRVVAVLDNMAVFRDRFFEFGAFALAVPLAAGTVVSRIRLYPESL